MLFCVVNTRELPTPGTHWITTSKFSRGWEQHGFVRINVIDNGILNSIPDSPETVWMISNHGIDDELNSKRLEPFRRFKESVFLLWYFHKYLRNTNNDMPFPKWVLTGVARYIASMDGSSRMSST